MKKDIIRLIAYLTLSLAFILYVLYIDTRIKARGSLGTHYVGDLHQKRNANFLGSANMVVTNPNNSETFFLTVGCHNVMTLMPWAIMNEMGC